MTLVFLLEERSMKVLLEKLLLKIVPKDVEYQLIPHQGKSDLKKSIPRKLKAWNIPDTKFIIVQDQDSNDCNALKQELEEVSEGYNREVLIRIVCHELESWYFGDLQAVSHAYGKDVTELAQKKKFRIPDQIENPKNEFYKLFPKHQQLDGARRIGQEMAPERNSSKSFQVFCAGIKKLINSEYNS